MSADTPVVPEVDEKNGNAVIARIFYIGATAEEAMKNYNDGFRTLKRVIRDAVTDHVVLALCKLLGFHNPGEFVTEFQRLQKLETEIPALVERKVEAYLISPGKAEKLADAISAANARRHNKAIDDIKDKISRLLPEVWQNRLQWGEFNPSDISDAIFEVMIPKRGEWMINLQDSDEAVCVKLASWLEAAAAGYTPMIVEHLGYTKMPTAQKATIIAVSRIALKHFGMTSDQLQKFIDVQVEQGILTKKK